MTNKRLIEEMKDWQAIQIALFKFQIKYDKNILAAYLNDYLVAYDYKGKVSNG